MDEEYLHSYEALSKMFTVHELRLLKLIGYFGNANYWLAVSLGQVHDEYEYRSWMRRSSKSWRMIVKLLYKLRRKGE
jgi:hypothetical protein